MTEPWLPTDRTVHTLDRRGRIRDWLVTPAWFHPVPTADLADLLAADGEPWGDDGRWVLTNGPDVAPFKQRLYHRHPMVRDQTRPAVSEGAELSWRGHQGLTNQARWQRVHTGDDGLVDWSRFCYTPEYSEALAATAIEVDQAEWRTVEVACTGPFTLWIGDTEVAHETTVTYMEPAVHRYRWRFTRGTTEIVIATWQVAFREVRHVLRVSIDGLPVRVVIPSPGADEYAAEVAEGVLDSLAVERWAVGDGLARLSGPPGAALLVTVDDVSRPVRIGSDGRATIPLDGDGANDGPAGKGVGDATADHPAAEHPDTDHLDTRQAEGSDEPAGDVTASMLTTGERVLTVRLDDQRCPVLRTLQVGVLPTTHRAHPGDSEPAQWRTELLDHVASGQPGTARALAGWALGRPGPFDPADLDQPLGMIDSRSDCADFEAVGLMNLWHRVPDAQWPAGGKDRVRKSLLGFKYWIDQPGLDAMCYFTENHQFVWHTAEILVGEALADERFDNTGWTGREHAAHGLGLAQEWIRRKLRGGFSEFDSNAYLAIDSLALASLLEHASDPGLRRSAEALLDKILVSLAANSWRGIHGSAHGRSYTPTLRSSRFEETAPIMWTLWGAGALNNAVLPATVLATAACYRLPAVVSAIAGELPDVWEGRQVYRGSYRWHHDLLGRPYGSDLRIWRTPDGMLSSVQDYRSGLPGLQEHIWGATLGPEVQVFATYPATDSISPSARPNAWAGQRILPRVRQFGDTVIALHARPTDDDTGTHLWFPAPLMDEVRRRDCWLAGRVGDGYVAVATAGGWRPVRTGPEAGQAFHPRGDGLGFVCTLGRAATDGSFAAFVESLGEPAFGSDTDGADVGEPAAEWLTRDGRRIALRWNGTPTVDGVPVDLGADGSVAGPPHLANPAGTSEFGDPTMTVQWGGQRLVLDLVNGRRLEPASGVRDGDPAGAGDIDGGADDRGR